MTVPPDSNLINYFIWYRVSPSSKVIGNIGTRERNDANAMSIKIAEMLRKKSVFGNSGLREQKPNNAN